MFHDARIHERQGITVLKLETKGKCHFINPQTYVLSALFLEFRGAEWDFVTDVSGQPTILLDP
jgi:hypothetical protein